MVAVIKASKSVHRILNYNENKVKQGKAVCIAAGNFPVDASQLSLTMKLNRFQKQMDLNSNVKTNSVHISLNFDSSEKNMPAEKLLQIADKYMEKIGFGRQPYLVYQHHDAAHPHIHLVTTNIEADGNRIDLHHLGIRKSEPARKEIEQAFNLVKAENQKKKEYKPEPVSARVQYGKEETKKAIENVLNFVVNNYKYTSLPELNAVLKLYNIEADKGNENSRVAKHNGLLYHALDEKGNRIGVPIKASMFYDKPTLKNLEKKFAANEIKRQPDKSRIKTVIDSAYLNGKIIILPQLVKQLQKEGIDTVLRQNAEGLVYGVTFVDHKNKSVFNGSSIGKEYSAKGLQDRCFLNQEKLQIKPDAIYSRGELTEVLKEHKDAMSIRDLTNFLEVFTKVEGNLDYSPKEFKRKKKRKKGRDFGR